MFRRFLLSAISALAFASVAMADGPAPSYLNSSGSPEGAKAVVLIKPDGTFYTATGGGGGGSGDASAANQLITHTKLDTLHTDLAVTIAGFVDGLEGYVDGLEGKFPSLGQKAASGSVAVTLSTDNLTRFDDIETLIGTSNTLATSANTKLDTIHGDFTGLALDASVDGIEGLLTTQAGYLDGLEALIGTTNANTTGLALNTSVDGIEGLIGTTNSSLTTIDGRVDTLEAAIGATNETAAATDTTTAGLNAHLKRLNQHATTTDAFLDGLEGLIGTTNTNTTGLALNTSVDGLEGFTDGLEALITSTNGFVDGLEGFTDGLEGLITSSNTKLDSAVTDLDNIDLHIGIKTETAPATDTASSGLNGRLQKIAQHQTATDLLLDGLEGLITSTNTKLDTTITDLDNIDIHIGVKTETAPATDTASSGLNGREQRIAQRLTTLIGVWPATLDMNSGNKSASTQRVTLATDQVQLTNALKVDGSAVTQPVSIASATGGDQSADGLATSLVGLNGRDFGYIFNGSTWDRNFSCQNTAVITVAAGTTVQIVALAAAKKVYVCSFVISTSNTTSSTGNVFKTGTGTLCATGITSLTGSMHMGPLGHIELSAPTGSPLFKSAAASAICLTNGTNGVDGFLTYAQF